MGYCVMKNLTDPKLYPQGLGVNNYFSPGEANGLSLKAGKNWLFLVGVRSASLQMVALACNAGEAQASGCEKRAPCAPTRPEALCTGRRV